MEKSDPDPYKITKISRCGGLVVSVPVSRPPVQGSNIGPGQAPQCGLNSDGRQITVKYC